VFRTIERVFLPPWQSVLNAFLALPSSTPLQVAYYRSTTFKRALQRLLPLHDACLAHLIRTADYLRGATTPCVLEMTDAISLNYARVKLHARTRCFRSLVYSCEAGRLLRYERQLLREFPLVSLVSHVDRDYLLDGQEGDLRKRVLVCSNGVDLAALPFAPDFREPVLAFIGNMTTLQNLDACQHFIEDILPVILARRPVVFRIVGRIKDTDAQRLRRYPRVEVAGSVTSIAHAVAGARAGLCPIRLGAGVQNKVLEYMALGLPVITSSIGLEGLSAVPGRDLLVANTPTEYADNVDKLWNDPPWALSIATAGRRYVERHHQWGASIAPLKDKLAKLVSHFHAEKIALADHRAA